MIETLQQYGFAQFSETCRGCPGPYGTKWRLGKWTVTVYASIGKFTVRKNTYVIHRGKEHELNEYLKKNL